MLRDIFNSRPFEEMEMIAAINRVKYLPGQIGALGLFREDGIRTIRAAIEDRSGSLALIQTTPRGGPPIQYTPGKRKIYDVKIPRIAVADTITADEIQGVNVFGTEGQLATIEEERNRRLEAMSADVDLTLEHLLFGALSGAVLDADGSTIVNLYTLFDQTPVAEIDFALDSSTYGETIQAIATMRRTMKQKLLNQGIRMTGIHAFADAVFMDNLQKCLDFKTNFSFDSYVNILQQFQVMGRVTWQGVTFDEYEPGDFGANFLGTGKAIFFPEGVDIYRIVYSPGDYLDTVNQRGLPRYARTAVDPEFNRFAKVEVQSNPLPYVTHPEALIKGDDGVA